MRFRIVLVLWGAALLPATAQPAQPVEQVNVYGQVSLPGFWKIAIPSSATRRSRAGTDAASMGEIVDGDGILPDHDIRFGPARDHLCRIGQGAIGLEIGCLGFGNGTVEADASHLTMAWSAGPGVRLTLRGTLNNIGGFGADFTFEQDREISRDGEKMAGSKFDLAHAAGDAPGLNRMLAGTLAALSGGDASLLQTLSPDVVAPPRELLVALGGVVNASWLGRAPRLRDAKQADFFEVYAVEFANGERLCGIHQSAYGKIDGLVCV